MGIRNNCGIFGKFEFKYIWSCYLSSISYINKLRNNINLNTFTMRRFFTILLLVFVFSSIFNRNAIAIPAYPNPIEFTQPDGSMFMLIMMGDEKVRWAQTLDGYTLLFNKHGFYEYAIVNDEGSLVPSGIKPNDIDSRTENEKKFISKIGKGLFFNPEQISIMKQIWDIQGKESTKAFPTTGNRKLLCILVGFKDKAFTKTSDDFNNLFNQVGYSVGGATGSVKDYYLENSYNLFNLTVDVVGPYTLSQNMSYYGGNDSNGNDFNPRGMAREAVFLASSNVNYADYDNDNDGIVDGIYIIYAGYGEEAGGGADAIWAHAWSLSPTVTFNNKVISKYSCSAELRGNSGSNISSIGVICHEFGHVLGAPDYYDTNYETGGKFDGTGKWDMMAGGSWNNNGVTPAHHNGFTKTMVYKWASVKVLESGTTITLKNTIDDSTSYYRINTKTNNEYFLLENREKHKFDGALPGSGMIIYHVHSGVFSSMNSNSINNTHPQRMYPVSANANSDPNENPFSYGNINISTCAWTGLGGKTEFSDTSIPSSKSWAGANTEKPLTNIWRDADSKTVTFDFMGGVTEADEFKAVAAGTNQIDLSWEIPDGKEILLAFSLTGEFGTPEDGNSYAVGETIPNGGTVIHIGSEEVYSHINLKSRTKYYYKIWMKLNDDSWSTGVEAAAETEYWIINQFPWVESFEDEQNSMPDWWWQEQLFEGSESWTVTESNGSTPAAAYDGQKFAILKDTDSDDDKTLLVSPELDLISLKTAELTFYLFMQENVGKQDELRVFYKSAWDDDWTMIDDAAYTTSINEWTQITLPLPEPLTSTYYIGFEGYTKNGSGICIDSVAVSGEPKTVYTLTFSFVGNGSVEINGQEYTEPYEAYEGTELNIEAIADFGWIFDGWSGDFEETENPASILMDSDKEITVTFTEKPKYSLEIAVVGNGTVQVDGEVYTEALMIYEGTQVALRAIPSSGWKFDEWTGDLTGTTNPQNLTVTANASVTATFTQSTSVDTENILMPTVYPNPFTGSLSINNTQKIRRILITNLVGQRVLEMELTGQQSVQLTTNHLPNGIYLISMVKSDGDKIVKKIVKR